MKTIAEVRGKFPQYDDMSDEELAAALHQKYYSDMDFADFSNRIGLKAEEQAPQKEGGFIARGFKQGVENLKSLGRGETWAAIGHTVAGMPAAVGRAYQGDQQAQDAIAAGAADAASFGNADEGRGFNMALLSAANKMFQIDPRKTTGPQDVRDLVGTYIGGRNTARREMEQLAQQDPSATAVGSVLGAGSQFRIPFSLRGTTGAVAAYGAGSAKDAQDIPEKVVESVTTAGPLLALQGAAKAATTARKVSKYAPKNDAEQRLFSRIFAEFDDSLPDVKAGKDPWKETTGGLDSRNLHNASTAVNNVKNRLNQEARAILDEIEIEAGVSKQTTNAFWQAFRNKNNSISETLWNEFKDAVGETNANRMSALVDENNALNRMLNTHGRITPRGGKFDMILSVPLSRYLRERWISHSTGHDEKNLIHRARSLYHDDTVKFGEEGAAAIERRAAADAAAQQAKAAAAAAKAEKKLTGKPGQSDSFNPAALDIPEGAGPVVQTGTGRTRSIQQILSDLQSDTLEHGVNPRVTAEKVDPGIELPTMDFEYAPGTRDVRRLPNSTGKVAPSGERLPAAPTDPEKVPTLVPKDAQETWVGDGFVLDPDVRPSGGYAGSIADRVEEKVGYAPTIREIEDMAKNILREYEARGRMESLAKAEEKLVQGKTSKELMKDVTQQLVKSLETRRKAAGLPVGEARNAPTTIQSAGPAYRTATQQNQKLNARGYVLRQEGDEWQLVKEGKVVATGASQKELREQGEKLMRDEAIATSAATRAQAKTKMAATEAESPVVEPVVTSPVEAPQSPVETRSIPSRSSMFDPNVAAEEIVKKLADSTADIELPDFASNAMRKEMQEFRDAMTADLLSPFSGNSNAKGVSKWEKKAADLEKKWRKEAKVDTVTKKASTRSVSKEAIDPKQEIEYLATNLDDRTMDLQMPGYSIQQMENEARALVGMAREALEKNPTKAELAKWTKKAASFETKWRKEAKSAAKTNQNPTMADAVDVKVTKEEASKALTSYFNRIDGRAEELRTKLKGRLKKQGYSTDEIDEIMSNAELNAGESVTTEMPMSRVDDRIVSRESGQPIESEWENQVKYYIDNVEDIYGAPGKKAAKPPTMEDAVSTTTSEYPSGFEPETGLLVYETPRGNTKTLKFVEAFDNGVVKVKDNGDNILYMQNVQGKIQTSLDGNRWKTVGDVISGEDFDF